MTAITYPASYATLSAFKRRIGIPDSQTSQDADLQSKLDAATEDINRWCGRSFWKWTDATARTFTSGWTGTDTDDFWTTDGLLISGTAWSSATVLEPRNGIQDGVPGWPYRRIVSSGLAGWATFLRPAEVMVTAKWGWADVPEGVVTACLLIAAQDNKAGDAPFGVAAFGDFAVRVRANPMAEQKLQPYIKDPVKVAT